MLPNQTPVSSVLPDPSMPYALDSPNRGRLLREEQYSFRFVLLSQISIQVLYGRLTKVSRIIFLYLRANQGFRVATSHTLRVLSDPHHQLCTHGGLVHRQ